MQTSRRPCASKWDVPFRVSIYIALLVALAGCSDRQGMGPVPPMEPGGNLVGAPTPPGAPPGWKDLNLSCLNSRVPVIMYHDVIAERTRQSEYFDVTASKFEREMQTLADAGAKTLTLDELYGHLTDGVPVPPNSIVLTFDDNYQGVNDLAAPILRKHGFKATVFVHTKFVGNVTQGRPKMDYPTLKALIDEGLIQVEAHTVTHPNLPELTEDQQRFELEQSKKELETNLGIKVDYMAYPTGLNDETTRRLCRELGYKMAFTMKGDFAEGSPDILRVNRFEQRSFDDAIEAQRIEQESAPLGFSKLPMKEETVTFLDSDFDGVKMVVVRGGTPKTVLASGRESVGQFVREANAVAGINGTFFVMAGVQDIDNRLIGPSQTAGGIFRPDDDPTRTLKLVNRPVVLWNGKEVALLPFRPQSMNEEAFFRTFMPDYSDLFLAGCWIVHEGLARTQEQMVPFASKDIMDFRRRAFLGFTSEGVLIAGASKSSVTTEQLARGARAAGAQEAVLLDSGFSTSLIFDGKVLASGHSSDKNPSRPVPHAIVISGIKDPNVDTSKLVEDDGSQGQGTNPEGRRRRRRR